MAIRAGAQQIDGSTRRFGAGAGNTPVEALVGVCDKLGITTGVDFFRIADAAEDVVRPLLPSECIVDRQAMMLGYAGCYSSFMKHAEGHAERYGVPASEILLRAGERRLVGGQEDQLIDIALEIQKEQATPDRTPDPQPGPPVTPFPPAQATTGSRWPRRPGQPPQRAVRQAPPGCAACRGCGATPRSARHDTRPARSGVPGRGRRGPNVVTALGGGDSLAAGHRVRGRRWGEGDDDEGHATRSPPHRPGASAP